MADWEMTDEQLAFLLQTSRDYAFEQMANEGKLIPFAGCANLDGDLEFARVVEDDDGQDPAEVYAATREAIAAVAGRGEIRAATLVSAVQLDPPEEGYVQAVRVHVEAPGFAREVIAPFAVEPPEGDADKGTLSLGDLIAYEAEQLLFQD